MSHRTMHSVDEPLSAALRSHSEFIDNFCADDVPESRPVQPTGWSSYLSPTYWARLAEDTLRKLIDKHLLQPPDDTPDSPSPSIQRPGSSGIPSSSSCSIPIATHSISSPSFRSTPPLSFSQRALTTVPVIPASRDLTRSTSVNTLPTTSPGSNARLSQIKHLRAGTSWTRLGPFFASSSRHVVSSLNP